MLKPNPPGGWARQYDPAVIPQMLESFYTKDLSGMMEAPPPGCSLHLARGTASSLWLEEDGEKEVGRGAGMGGLDGM